MLTVVCWFIAVTKQTKTIQFSLMSPAVLTTGWVVGGKERRGKGSRRTKEKNKGRRKRGDTQIGRLPADILELLKSVRYILNSSSHMHVYISYLNADEASTQGTGHEDIPQQYSTILHFTSRQHWTVFVSYIQT